MPTRLNVGAVPESGCFGLCDDFASGKCVCAVTCKLCVRSFGQPCPLGRGGMLKRSGGKGRTCDCCRNALHWRSKVDTAAERQKRLEAIERDTGVDGPRAKHQDDVAEWEDLHRGGETRLGKTQITAKKVSGSVFEAKQHFGFLWMPDLWASFFQKTMPTERLVTIEIENVGPVTGIIEPPAAGWAPGVFELSQKHFSAPT